MTTVGFNASATVSLSVGDDCLIESAGGFATVTEAPSYEPSNVWRIGPSRWLRRFGPYERRTVLTITNSTAVLSYTHTVDTVGGAPTGSQIVTALNAELGSTAWQTNNGGGTGDMALASDQTITGVKTFGAPGAAGKLKLAGVTSGTTILNASAAAGDITVTLPGLTTTLVGRSSTDTLTNKTLTAPVMTGPVLGTPASGNLSNCTAVPAAQVVGVIPIANLATGTPTGSKFIRDDGVLAAIAGGGDAVVANPLSQFASTTSTQLRGVISDSTGTGSAVFAAGPSITLANGTGLPISTGVSGLGTGVATFLATPSSANLRAAVTDESGSGALLFANGALGTPASGVATNLTGLPLTSGVTGTLPVANGGTANTTLAGFNADLLTIAPTVVVDATQARTLAAGDNNKIIRCTSSSAVTITVPTTFSTYGCTIVRAGTGTVTIAASGTTLNGASLVLNGIYSSAIIAPTGSANTFDVIGGTGSVSGAEEAVASAITTNLGATATIQVSVTGTTGITSFGTAAAGVQRWVRFTGILTMTHHATSLILPNGGSNITTAAGDRLMATSLGSGNWVVNWYTRSDGTSVSGGGGSGTVTSVSVVTANGVSGSVANATSTPAVTLTLGAITPTTVNGNTITTGTGTLTLAAGKTLTASNTIALAGTDSTTMTFPPASASIGYLGLPQNTQSADYTCVLADAGKHILHPSADTTARVFTIPANASVAYAVGTTLTFINKNAGGVITIAVTSDTMRLAGAGTTGSRTLAANGIATAIKIASTEWIVSGTGLT